MRKLKLTLAIFSILLILLVISTYLYYSYIPSSFTSETKLTANPDDPPEKAPWERRILVTNNTKFYTLQFDDSLEREVRTQITLKDLNVDDTIEIWNHQKPGYSTVFVEATEIIVNRVGESD